jgi:hypothetical protein
MIIILKCIFFSLLSFTFFYCSSPFKLADLDHNGVLRRGKFAERAVRPLLAIVRLRSSVEVACCTKVS